jgi:hypothetical protein
MTETGPSAAAKAPERRRHERFPLPLSVVVRFFRPDGRRIEYRCVTRDIGEQGIYFWSDRGISVGQRLELQVPLPREVTGQQVGSVRFFGTALRVEPPGSPDEPTGVAAQLEEHEFMAAN